MIVKPQHSLKSQCNLRNQHNRLFSHFYDLFDHFHIDFCLTTSGNSIKEICLSFSCLIILHESTDRSLLLFGVNDLLSSLFLIIDRITQHIFIFNSKNLLFFQRADHGTCHIQFLRQQFVFLHRLIQKSCQQSGSCFLVLMQINIQLALSGFFI